VAQKLREVFGEALTPDAAVERIIAGVAAKGDEAVLDYARRIDGWEGGALAVAPEEMDAAARAIEPELLDALEEAAGRIRSFHQACLPMSWFDEQTGLGQSIQPLAAVGVYVPGGTAAYPSTVLHTAIPARVAGVERVVMATPPGRDGRVHPAVLMAARIARVDQVYRMGGAQAIAALALGTRSVARVDKIVGPGNIFVTIAKRKLYGAVGIDGLAGPTETLIVADDSARAEVCAADLLAQAEHDPMAMPVLVTTSARLAEEVRREVGRQLPGLERAEIAQAAIEGQGLIAEVASLDDALALAIELAPEHLCLMVREPRRWAQRVRNAGAIFLGESSPEVLGDYNAGPSHVMPTGGTARFASALGLHDFVKVTSVVGLSAEESARLAPSAARIARAEGLTAHARSAELRAAKPRARTGR
jgi:histidinol dehydrogenase